MPNRGAALFSDSLLCRSADVLRVTQAERIHCLVLFVRMLITRSRFSWRVGERVRTAHERSGGHADTNDGEQTEAERAAMMSCHQCAVELVHAHTQIAKKGLMTYCKFPQDPQQTGN